MKKRRSGTPVYDITPHQSSNNTKGHLTVFNNEQNETAKQSLKESEMTNAQQRQK